MSKQSNVQLSSIVEALQALMTAPSAAPVAKPHAVKATKRPKRVARKSVDAVVTHEHVSIVRDQRDALRLVKRPTPAQKQQLAYLENLLSATRKEYRQDLANNA